MKHNPRKTRWTKAFRRAAGKEMVNDATFEFEKRRNRPIKYNRDLVIKTIQVMKVVDRIKQARKERFHKARLAATRAARIGIATNEIKDNLHLLLGNKMPDKYNKSDEAQAERNVKAAALVNAQRTKLKLPSL